VVDHTGTAGTVTGMHWLPWAEAWDESLYGPAGFYRRAVPADHFTTSPAHGTVFAEVVGRIAGDAHLDHVVDVGAGSGELVRALHALDATLRLTAVELRPRPADLPSAIEWTDLVPDRIDGVLVANEYLDNVPCPVVERADDGVVRLVEVSRTGHERLGECAPEDDVGWLADWWPLSPAAPRAEVGRPRDRVWTDLTARVRNGVAIAIDYGHVRSDRPRTGSLRAYRGGAEVAAVPDGGRDITAHVAVDAVAAASGSRLLRQRDALARWTDAPSLPTYQQARHDPRSALRRIAASSERGVLRAPAGLGDFWWIMTTRGEPAGGAGVGAWPA
jgi:SAM-dependent MidA family methyltransferase